MFPIPRITESFVDSVAHDLGWHRYLDVHTPAQGRLNADYLCTGAIIELKIIEEEGLEKAERQEKLAKLLSTSESNGREVDLDFESIGLGEAGGPKSRFDADSKCREEGFKANPPFRRGSRA